MARKSQTLVSVNSKLSAVNIMTVPIDGSATFAAGQPIKLDTSTGKAAACAAGDSPAVANPPAVFINWFASTRSDVAFIQGDGFDDTAPDVHIDGGGLAAIVGNVVDVGLPASLWAAGSLPTVGSVVRISAATPTKFGVDATPTAGSAYYGKVYRHYNGRAYFLFSSMPICIT
jgi:hypothetical protein